MRILDEKTLEEIFKSIEELADDCKEQRADLRIAVDEIKAAISDGDWKKIALSGASLFRDLADIAKAGEALTSQQRQSLDLAAKILLELRRIQLEKERLALRANPDDYTKTIEDLSYDTKGKKTDKAESSALESKK